MTTLILESVERGLVSQLLAVTSIFDSYTENSDRWAILLGKFRLVNDGLVDANNNPLIFTPREAIGLALPTLAKANSSFLATVRVLENSQMASQRDTYHQLVTLQMTQAVEPDQKAFFLVLGKVGETKGVYDEV